MMQIRGSESNDYLYVAEGNLEVIQRSSIRSLTGHEDTRNRPFILPSAPSTGTIVARENSIICHADRAMLDNVIACDEMVHLIEETDSERHGRLELVRDSLAFRRLPLEPLESAFEWMDIKTVKAGEDIIRMDELDKNQRYIVYFYAGGRSAVATLILNQNQFDVVSPEGGIRDWPFETTSAEETVGVSTNLAINAN
jgi:rhodanese-related sulfurtransferase